MKIERRCKRCRRTFSQWIVERWSNGRILVECADCAHRFWSRLRSSDGPAREYPVTHQVTMLRQPAAEG